MSNVSRLAMQGSHTSASSSGSIDSSSHHHFMSLNHSVPALPPWGHEAWRRINIRYERMASGATSRGIAVMTREVMEIHAQQAPDVRGILDFLPVADRSNAGFVGWRQKLGTWPCSSKHDAQIPRQFAA